jgi:hypothetical protein
VTLKNTLDAAVAICSYVCSELADRVAVAEEHLPAAASADGPRLAGHARALTHSTSSREVI